MSAGHTYSRRLIRFAASALVFSLFVVAGAAEGSSLDESEQASALNLYNQGCALYEKSDFKGARESLLQAASTGWQNPALFYNLGNCYFRLGDLGRAILYYEKAKQLAPRDASIAHNLSLSRARIVDKVEPEDRNILAELFIDLHRLLNTNEWTVFSVAAYLALMSLLILLRFLKSGGEEDGKTGTRRILGRLAVLALLALVFCGTNALVKIYVHRTHTYGVVVAEVEEARSGPGESFAEVFQLHSGTKVRIRNEQKDWRHVSLDAAGLSGWLPRRSVENI